MATELQKHGEGSSRADLEHATTGLKAKELGFNVDTAKYEGIYKMNGGSFLHFPSLERLDDIGAGVSGASLIGVEDDSFSSISGDTDLQTVLKSIDTAIAGITAVDGSDYLQHDGSVALTANWDVGDFEITNIGGLTLSAGSDLTGSTTSDIAFGVDKLRWEASNQTLKIKTRTNVDGIQLRKDSDDSILAQIGLDAQDDAHLFLRDNTATHKVALRTDLNHSYIAGGGYFGINTTTPAAMLDVHGNIYAHTTPADGSENRFEVIVGGSSDPAKIRMYNAAETQTIELNAGGDSYLDGGKLGLGTTNPNALLHITGNVSATGGRAVTIDPDLTLAGGVTTGFLLGLNSSGLGSITTEDNSVTYSTVGTLDINDPIITKGASDTITNAYSLRVSNAPTEGVNNYAFWVDNGVSRFDGDIDLQANADLYLSSTSEIVSASNITINPLNTLTIGDGGTGIDYKIQLIGENSTGTIEWKEDESRLDLDRTKITGGTTPTLAITEDMNTLRLINLSDGAGVNNFGARIGFSGPGQADVQATLGTIQTGADSNNIGLTLNVHESSTGADPMVEALRIEHDKEAIFRGDLTLYNAVDPVEFSVDSGTFTIESNSNTISFSVGSSEQVSFDSQDATFGIKVTTPASASGDAGFNMPHGSAPTSPDNGDVWTTTGGLFARINGATEQYAKLASPTFTGTANFAAINSTGNLDVGGITSSGIGFDSGAGAVINLDDNQRIELGTGGDAHVYYEGTHLVIDPAVVGSGKLHVGSDVWLYDNDKSVYGTGEDAEIYYDGTDLKINPKAVGSGELSVDGDISADNFKTGSFTATLTGCTTSPTATFTYKIVGDFVILHMNALSATSNANTCTVTGAPSEIQPASAQTGIVSVIDSGLIYAGGVTIQTSGTLTLRPRTDVSGDSAWVTSGNKGFNDTTITYSLL
jgi:hypothetical protein